MNNIENNYTKLINKYREDTAMLSFTKTNHPAFQEIVKMGMSVLPYIIRDLKENNMTWGLIEMICLITGEHPDNIPKKDYGKTQKIRKYYLEWIELKGWKAAEGKSVSRLRFY
jgi:hypothetical protein